MVLWKKELTEVERLKKENAELQKKLEESKYDARMLRWRLLSEEEKEIARLCYRMLVKETPDFNEREKFKEDFIIFRWKAMFRRDYTKEAERWLFD